MIIFKVPVSYTCHKLLYQLTMNDYFFSISFSFVLHETNSPCQHLRKCIENSMENMHTDVRLLRVKLSSVDFRWPGYGSKLEILRFLKHFCS